MTKESSHPVSSKARITLGVAATLTLLAGFGPSLARADDGWRGGHGSHGGWHEGWHGGRGWHHGWDHHRGGWRGNGWGGYYPDYAYIYPPGYGYSYATPYAYVAPVPVYPPVYGYFGW